MRLPLFASCLLFAALCNAAPEGVNPCQDSKTNAAKMRWCDASLDMDERVKDMISHMSLEEKLHAMVDKQQKIDSLDLPYFDWWSEASHGVASSASAWGGSEREFKETVPPNTNFPFPITTAMSFNRSLWLSIGAQIGREARALYNIGAAYGTYWAPVVNLARDPRWGRNIETAGEDPYLTGEYSSHFVKGMEQNPDDPKHIQASCNCKHFVANEMEHSMENGITWSRHNFSATINKQDLVDSYLAPFQTCVEKGKVSGLMCSYNSINGVPACANKWLLSDVARDTWKFDGYISSDCGASMDVWKEHKLSESPEETMQKILQAGTDVTCGGFVNQHAQDAYDKGLITTEDIDKRLRNIFRVRMRLGHFDPKSALDDIKTSEICSQYSKDLARDATAQSITLLKNNDNLLPLDLEKIKVAAVIGPNGNQGGDTFTYYGPTTSCDNKFYNMVDAIQQYVKETKFARGLDQVDSNLDRSDVFFQKSMGVAEDKDAVILALGTDHSVAHEELDVASLHMPQGQLDLVDEVCKRHKGLVIVVMLTAVPLDITPLLSNSKIGAILHVGQPSVQTLGVGDVIFGKKSPAGRLIQTIYPASYADQISIFDFNMRPGPSEFYRPDCHPKSDQELAKCPKGTNPGRTYRFYTDKPVFPFGFGLSYSKFEYELVNAPAALSLSQLDPLIKTATAGLISTQGLDDAGPAAKYMVKVKNVGSVDADNVVLGFLEPPGAGKNGVPLKVLFGFERVHVPAGKDVTVKLWPSLNDFTYVNDKGERVALPGTYKVMFGVKEASGMGYVEKTVIANPKDPACVLQSVIWHSSL